MMETKPIRTIKLNNDEIDKIANNQWETRVEEYINNTNQILNKLLDEIEILFKKTNWLKMEGDVFYNQSISAIFPDLSKFKVSSCDTYRNFDESTFKKNFSGFKGELMTESEYKKVFAKQWDHLSNLYGWPTYPRYTIVTPDKSINENTISRSGSLGRKWGSYKSNALSYHIPIFRLSSVNAEAMPIGEVILKWLHYSLIPFDLSTIGKNNLMKISELYNVNNKLFWVKNDRLCCNKPAFVLSIKSQKLSSLVDSKLFQEETIHQFKKEKRIKIMDISIMKNTLDKLLKCDKIRADIEPYDEKILTDPNRGHWDLWDMESSISEDDTYGEISDVPFMARNPISDIREDGVIGIDFGTKSTVVVFQEDSEHTLPMRIGTGHLSKQIEAIHYENPTVMEIIDFESFIKKYEMKKGRPETLWEDLTTSHTAFEGFLNSSSKDYYSYLYELKQWAGDKQRQIRLRDKKSKDLILPPFLKIGDENFNPIELYAYYIGLYINNMHNGIYLDYYLSYPVTYEKEIRDKIVESFEKGIKKSLPETVLKNTEVMSNFKVRVGASEPVAYAMCALDKYGFDPVDDEQVFYGVFDFGGGTTDFDFGLYREARENERRWDYVIESFGAGGDQYLGGENILELLAFEVFKANKEKLRVEGITFQLPPECKRFLGSETLLSGSQEAKLNMAQVVEKLRPFWERHENYEKVFEQGFIKVTLFDSYGVLKSNFELKVDIKELDEIIYSRIEKGVRNFFLGLVEAFNLPYDTDKINCFNIFLAGNSCKSIVVEELFQKYIKDYNEKICKNSNSELNHFKVFPPLGTAKSREIQEEMGLDFIENDLENPTGKTGVAFGLIRGRQGGKIKVITEKTKDQEIKFMYYIGNERKRKFKVLSDREIPYGKWILLIDAEEEDFTIYYSTLPECVMGSMDILNVSRKKCRIPETFEGANVYYRAIAPSSIEYVVAFQDKIEANDYLSEIFKLNLGGE